MKEWKVKNETIILGSAPRIAAASCLGAWGTPHKHPWGLGDSQIHTIGDMGLGDSQTACVFLIGVRAFSRIAAASCLGAWGTPHKHHGAWATPKYTPSEIWGLGTPKQLASSLGSAPRIACVPSWGMGYSPYTRHRRYTRIADNHQQATSCYSSEAPHILSLVH